MSGRDLAGGVAPPAAVRGALELLGVRRLLLGIHDAAFPADPEGDLGRGTPYGRAGRDLLAFARSLGFTGVQLGIVNMTRRLYGMQFGLVNIVSDSDVPFLPLFNWYF